MASEEKTGAASQKQDSRQSAEQGEPKKQTGRPAGGAQPARSGIGSSQGQDRASPERPSAGTADIERGGGSQDVERGGAGSRDSLVNDPTGAFKERP